MLEDDVLAMEPTLHVSTFLTHGGAMGRVAAGLLDKRVEEEKNGEDTAPTYQGQNNQVMETEL